MFEPKKILVAVDGSESSLNAARAALTLAKKFDSVAYIAYVVQFPGYFGFSEPAMSKTVETVLEQYKHDASIRSSKWLSEIALEGTNQGVKVKTEILNGDSSVVNALNEFATKNEIDLIVVGSRGQGGFKRLVLGSVSDGI